MTSYKQAHQNVELIHGRAKDHTCSCGAPAFDWAYQHTAGAAELRHEEGWPYSTNPADYKAMCRPCHSELDGTMDRLTHMGRAAWLERYQSDPEFREQQAERLNQARGAFLARLASDPEFRERHSRGCGLGRAALVEHLASDPEFRESYSQAARRGGERGGPAMAARLATDPEFRERHVRTARQGGAATSSMRRRCQECDMVCNPGAMAGHQRRTGHSGHEEVAR